MTKTYHWVVAVKGSHRRWLAGRRISVGLGVALAWASLFHAPHAAADPDPLAARGYAVTSGAAPGYVDDRVCAACHPDLHESYQEVSMSRAFYRPRPDRVIEDFSGDGFFHERSNRHYRMTLRDGRYVFRRHQLDAENRETHVFEREVDWILGSGSRARTYLYHTPGGELYQLPIAWYTQTATWGMAPGYDRPDHDGVRRQVRRECMFCHNAYPDVPAGSDAYDAPHTYPEELPEGLGCQRCHGPGAEHARAGMREPVDFKRLASSILNPANLPARLSRDICYGCHMQPEVAIDSVRVFGRGDYSFEPGEPLADYLVHLDMEEEGKDRGHRFEINHHPYRLEQSRCFVESSGALGCLTCHDPHRMVAPAERAAHYRAACLGCHQVDACGLPAMAAGEPATGIAAAPDDCVACHMQDRRPQDAVEVVVTDHFIRRRPAGEERLARLAEEAQPVVLDVTLLSPERAPGGRLGDVYRAAGAVRGHGGALALDWLEQSLAGAVVTSLDPYLDLARGRLEDRQPARAEPVLARILKRSPDHPQALEWSAIAAAGLGRPGEALARLWRVAELYPRRPESRLQLGRLLIGLGRPEEAVPHLRRALELRPNLVKAHLFLGHAQVALDRPEGAAESYRRALEIEPSDAAAREALTRLSAEPRGPR